MIAHSTNRFAVTSILNSTFHSGLIGIALTLVLLGIGSQTLAQQFKLDSQVYQDGQTTPIGHSLTIFIDGLVYDIAFSPDDATSIVEIVVYDSHTKSFEILDNKNNRRVHLEQFEIVRMLENQRQQGLQDERLIHLVRPNLVEDVDLSEGRLTMSNAMLRYDAKCEKLSDPIIQSQFYEFLDQYSRLSVSDPRRLPPFARLEFNQALMKYNLVPKAIHLTLSGGDISKSDLALVSKHTLIKKLSDDDKKRVEQIRLSWPKMDKVSIADFRGIEKVAERSSTKTSNDR